MKELGGLISYDLTWGAQVDASVITANKILGIVHRTVGPANQGAFSILTGHQRCHDSLYCLCQPLKASLNFSVLKLLNIKLELSTEKLK